MFDYIKIDDGLLNMLPLSSDEYEILKESNEWQSKDFEALWGEVDLYASGGIHQHEYDYIKENIDPKFTGTVSIYSAPDGKWVEFDIEYKDGVVVNVERCC